MSRKLTKKQRKAQQIRSANKLSIRGTRQPFHFGGRTYFLRKGGEPWRERIIGELT